MGVLDDQIQIILYVCFGVYLLMGISFCAMGAAYMGGTGAVGTTGYSLLAVGLLMLVLGGIGLFANYGENWLIMAVVECASIALFLILTATLVISILFALGYTDPVAQLITDNWSDLAYNEGKGYNSNPKSICFRYVKSCETYGDTYASLPDKNPTGCHRTNVDEFTGDKKNDYFWQTFVSNFSEYDSSPRNSLPGSPGATLREKNTGYFEPYHGRKHCYFPLAVSTADCIWADGADDVTGQTTKADNVCATRRPVDTKADACMLNDGETACVARPEWEDCDSAAAQCEICQAECRDYLTREARAGTEAVAFFVLCTVAFCLVAVIYNNFLTRGGNDEYEGITMLLGYVVNGAVLLVGFIMVILCTIRLVGAEGYTTVLLFILFLGLFLLISGALAVLGIVQGNPLFINLACLFLAIFGYIMLILGIILAVCTGYVMDEAQVQYDQNYHKMRASVEAVDNTFCQLNIGDCQRVLVMNMNTIPISETSTTKHSRTEMWKHQYLVMQAEATWMRTSGFSGSSSADMAFSASCISNSVCVACTDLFQDSGSQAADDEAGGGLWDSGGDYPNIFEVDRYVGTKTEGVDAGDQYMHPYLHAQIAGSPKLLDPDRNGVDRSTSISPTRNGIGGMGYYYLGVDLHVVYATIKRNYPLDTFRICDALTDLDEIPVDGNGDGDAGEYANDANNECSTVGFFDQTSDANLLKKLSRQSTGAFVRTAYGSGGRSNDRAFIPRPNSLRRLGDMQLGPSQTAKGGGRSATTSSGGTIDDSNQVDQREVCALNPGTFVYQPGVRGYVSGCSGEYAPPSSGVNHEDYEFTRLGSPADIDDAEDQPTCEMGWTTRGVLREYGWGWRHTYDSPCARGIDGSGDTTNCDGILSSLERRDFKDTVVDACPGDGDSYGGFSPDTNPTWDALQVLRGSSGAMHTAKKLIKNGQDDGLDDIDNWEDSGWCPQRTGTRCLSKDAGKMCRPGADVCAPEDTVSANGGCGPAGDPQLIVAGWREVGEAGGSSDNTWARENQQMAMVNTVNGFHKRDRINTCPLGCVTEYTDSKDGNADVVESADCKISSRDGVCPEGCVYKPGVGTVDYDPRGESGCVDDDGKDGCVLTALEDYMFNVSKAWRNRTDADSLIARRDGGDPMVATVTGKCEQAVDAWSESEECAEYQDGAEDDDGSLRGDLRGCAACSSIIFNEAANVITSGTQKAECLRAMYRKAAPFNGGNDISCRDGSGNDCIGFSALDVRSCPSSNGRYLPDPNSDATQTVSNDASTGWSQSECRVSSSGAESLWGMRLKCNVEAQRTACEGELRGTWAVSTVAGAGQSCWDNGQVATGPGTPENGQATECCSDDIADYDQCTEIAEANGDTDCLADNEIGTTKCCKMAQRCDRFDRLRKKMPDTFCQFTDSACKAKLKEKMEDEMSVIVWVGGIFSVFFLGILYFGYRGVIVYMTGDDDDE
jgi:hypothetical protein